MAILYGDETASTVRRSQVYQATHNGEGQTLPYMNRSFISFTYGGKKIEDFDLIATISGDRLNRPGYASFEDTVTTYDNLDGQYYWATHYKTNQLDLTLSTDGIDQKQLDNFLHWFKAGISRELILAEHPNRAIMARVAEPPTLNLLPFEHDVNVIISSVSYKTKTTLYKGDIELKLTMDEPHWYAITNILGKRVESDGGGSDRFVDYWDDPFTGQENISIFASQDALKILYEDGIPLGSMIAASVLLGNGAYANVDTQSDGQIWSVWQSADGTDPTAIPEPDSPFWTEGYGARINGTIIGDESPASEYEPGTYIGIIAGAIVDASDNGITTLAKDTNGYFFYSGTAPAPTIISFTLTPALEGYYISEPCNSFANTNDKKYNTFSIKSITQSDLQFTTPNIYTSYNKAQQIFATYTNSANNWEKVRELLRDSIRHPKVREYAISVLNAVQNGASDTATITASGITTTIQDNMKKFLTGSGSTVQPATFTFNSKTGEAKGKFSYYADGSLLTSDQEEDVGDMLRSNYIIIQDRNYPDSDGKIQAWSAENPQYSHCIVHDVNGGLSNIQILYKNMYL